MSLVIVNYYCKTFIVQVTDERLKLFADKCQDFSDTINPHNHQECQEPFMKYCKDEQMCMHEHLFCDGHVQCEDKSDEDQAFCRQCPRYFSL